FVKEDGLWKLREMRVFPLFRSDYRLGWGKSRLVEQLSAALAPDSPLPQSDAGEQDRLIPAFVSLHPVTAAPVAAPPGMKVVAAEPLKGEIASVTVDRSGDDRATRLLNVERRL